MGDILEHWEQRVVVVVPGDLCLDHQHGDHLHLQVLFKSYRADIAAINSHQHLAKEKTEHLCGAQLLQEGKFSHTNIFHILTCP